MPILPGFGGNLSVRTRLADGFVFGVLGAFSDGDFIRRMFVTWSTRDAGALIVAAALGGSRDASQDTLNAGRPVVARSFTAIGETSGISWQVAAGAFGHFVVPVGMRVSSSAKYMVVGWSSSNTLFAECNVGVEVVRIDKRKD